jgi:hypothetical protein
MMWGMTRRLRVSVLCISAVLAVLIGGGGWWLSPSTPALPEVSESTVARPDYLGPDIAKNPWVYFVGDSFNLASSGSGWTTLVATEEKWYEVSLSVEKSGYVATGSDGTTYLDRILGTRLEGANMVVVSGGYGDVLRSRGETIGPAVLKTLTTVRHLAPHVPLVVISVFSPARSPKLDAVNTVLKRVAGKLGATYIDVSGLLIDSPGSISEDGVTPSDLGQHLIADAIGKQLPEPAAAPVR